MRKITKESTKAFLNGESFSKSNMIVEYLKQPHTDSVHMYLHGNEIARIESFSSLKPKLLITNCGWFTNTTKERLNALPNVSIQQKNFVWYLNGKEWSGELTEIKL